jgi:hypothetical protein
MANWAETCSDEEEKNDGKQSKFHISGKSKDVKYHKSK